MFLSAFTINISRFSNYHQKSVTNGIIPNNRIQKKICIKYVIFDFKFYKFDMLDRISLILNKTIYL